MKLDASISLSVGEERIEREDGPIRREDGALRFGGQGSGCQGPNCGRPKGEEAQQAGKWLKSGLVAIIRKELEQAGYKIQVYGKIPDTEIGKRPSIGERFTYQHPEGHRATVSVGIRPKDNYWAMKHTEHGHAGGKLYELAKARKAIAGSLIAATGGQGGWQYGFRHPTGYIPQRTLMGFPRSPGGRGHLGAPAIPKGPGISRRPNPSLGHSVKGPGMFKPNPSLHHLRSKSEGAEPPETGAYSYNQTERSKWFDDPIKKIKADFDGEPSSTMQHAHIDPRTVFHPPSLVKRGQQDHTPTDDPGETDDKFFDVTKRNSKDTWEERMKLLKRAAPGGAPAQIPARTTLIPMHQGSYLPSAMMSVEKSKVKLKQRPINWDKQPRQRISYARRGCI